ncbi:MAG TPA: glucosyl-3-phosphoglycerate synthase [Solirubrobacteraceae bacterium]
MRARTFHHSAFSAERIAAERAQRGLTIAVCLPARECAGTVGEIVTALSRLRESGAIDRIVVVDAASRDGTAGVAERAGAEVWQEAELLPSFGAVLGKGDAMWRACSRLDSDLVCFLDADTERFSEHFATGLLGPLVCEPRVEFVKAFYRRPLGAAGDHRAAGDGATVPDGPTARDGAGARDGATAEGGGRVNHLTARPALALLYPELAQIRQPLAGEVAARRELLQRLPFATGYGVEVAMLIDAWRAVGLDGIAQVDLEEHHNRHQPLSALAPMALTVLATIAERVQREGRLVATGRVDDADGAEGALGADRADDAIAALAPLERPPLASLTVA